MDYWRRLAMLCNKKIRLLEEQVRKLTERVEDLEDKLLEKKLSECGSRQEQIREYLKTSKF